MKKKDIIKKLCLIQRQFNNAVVFRIGIRDNGKVIDIISADNTFSNKNEPEQELELQLPEYIG
ncbi:MAG TPA: hypothetical protein VJ461_05840 [Candidatus Nanoarchaeia archaeon]|nr:hypothetical protein [Candidatus Nanoarchaeia archaeon]